jgi:hypothetical protein
MMMTIIVLQMDDLLLAISDLHTLASPKFGDSSSWL